MQINKKLLTIAVTALLLISMLAAAAPAFATPLNNDVVATIVATGATTGFTVGNYINVTGTGASFGGQVQLYWDNLAGEAINGTYARGDGAYGVCMTIPAAVNGAHYIIVKDSSTGSTAQIQITVNAKITISPSRGIAGDVITVTGSGFLATTAYTLSLGTTPVTDITPSGTPKSSALGAFTATFSIPAAATPYGTFVVTASQSGLPTPLPTANLIVSASITLTPNKGPAGTVVTITGRGFLGANEAAVTLAFADATTTLKVVAPIKLASDGTFSGQFIVPEVSGAMNANHAVTANDLVTTVPSIPSANFNVTGLSGITITPSSAAPGAPVTIEGSNFTAIAGTVVKLNFGSLLEYASFTTNSTGGFKATFNVPMLPTTTYVVVATDSSFLVAAIADYQLALTMISVTPGTGPSGSVVTVSGYGFNVGETFNVTFASIRVIPEVTGITIAAGGAVPSGVTFRVPTITPTTYSVTLTDHKGLTATTTFTVNATSQVALGATSAPKDAPVRITVRNFGPQTGLRFYIANSSFSRDITSDVDPVAPWTTLTTNGSEAEIGFFIGEFTISASDIAKGSYTIIVNNTVIGAPSPLAAGYLNATASFTIGSATFTVSTRASEYRQGDLVSFKITSSFAQDFEITIVDPEGVPLYLSISQYDFVQVGGNYIIPIGDGNNIGYSRGPVVQLPSDAVTGTWCWNTTAIAGEKPTGEFAVVQGISNELTDISDKLDEMKVTLVSVKDNVLTIKTATSTIQATLADLNAKLVSIEGKVATIDTNVGQIKVSIADLPASVSSSVQTAITNGMATITTSIGTITTKLSSLESSLTAVKGDVATIKTSIGDITTTLTAINTKVISIEGNVATIKTDVGTLSGVVAEVKDSIATINTSVGTITTSVANLQPEVTQANDNTSSMSTMIYVAVAFAIIAAIAAVASILLMRKKIAS